MLYGNLLPALVFALFIASAMSAFAAFRAYKKSRTKQSSKAVTLVMCTVFAILFAFGAVWAMMAHSR